MFVPVDVASVPQQETARELVTGWSMFVAGGRTAARLSVNSAGIPIATDHSNVNENKLRGHTLGE